MAIASGHSVSQSQYLKKSEQSINGDTYGI